MRKSKAETAKTRQHIIRTAAAEFHRDGIGETGLADVMANAGLARGGFYRHFDSKNERALVVLSAMVGALTLARIVDDPALSDRILHETRRHIATV